MALIESVTEVNMNRTAEIVVALESVVAAPRGPNAAAEQPQSETDKRSRG